MKSHYPTSSGWWPVQPPSAHPPHRRLIGDDGHRSWTATLGRLIDRPATYDAWVRWGLRGAFLAIAPKLSEWRWMAEAMADPRCEVAATGTRGIVGLRWRGGPHGRHLWLLSAATWGDGVASRADLGRLERLWRLAGVGQARTPAQLGQALWARDWWASRRGRAKTPPASCQADLVRSAIGGRVDWFADPSLTYARVYEIDLNASYASCSRQLPVGTAMRVGGTDLPGSAGWDAEGEDTWLRDCVITIPEPGLSCPGPFPVRQPDGRVRYPTEAGTYRTMLWKTTAEDCRAVGARVAAGAGWAWRLVDAPEFADTMHRLRQQAPADLAPLIKLATVAGIGRFGSRGTCYRSVDPRDAAEGDVPVCDGRGAPTAMLRPQAARSGPSTRLGHWNSWIVNQARRRLWHRMVAEIAAGNTVLCSNYDSLTLAEPPLGPTGDGLGEWKLVPLHQARFRHPRWVESTEKSTTPGQPHAAAHSPPAVAA